MIVLVADDDFSTLEMLSMALEGHGHRVLKAGDGADALRILAGQRCDVVVCDDEMPSMDGHQLIAAMRAEPRLAPIPVVFMTETLGAKGPACAEHVLAKPIVLADVLRAVERAGKARRTS